MTVEELIEVLKKYPAEERVYIGDEEGEILLPVTEVDFSDPEYLTIVGAA
jgi:hypothetical protein